MNNEPLLFYKYNTSELDNVVFELEKPKMENESITRDYAYEGVINGYYIALKVDSKIYIYYRAGHIEKKCKNEYGKLNIRDEGMLNNQYLCIAESKDGIYFKKPKLELYKYEKLPFNNVLKKDKFCHNFFPYYHDNQYLAISGVKKDTDGVFLFTSKDGISWEKKNRILNEKHIVSGWGHKNHFDSLNNILYNPNEKKYFIYLRNNFDGTPSRRVQLSKSKDLKKFENCINVNMDNFNNELYVPGITYYPDTNYFISISTTHNYQEANNKKQIVIMISKDGVNFSLITDDLFPNDDLFPGYGILRVHDKTLIYMQKGMGTKYSRLNCYSFNNHRVACLFAKEKGSFTSKKIKLNNFYLQINFTTIDDGNIQIELYNKRKLLERSEIFSGDEKKQKIKFKKRTNKDKYYFKFILNKAKVYSYSYS